MNRRDLLKSAAALAAAGLPAPAAFLTQAAYAAEVKPLGKPQAFDFATLKGRARTMAGTAYAAPSNVLPKPIAALDWDKWQSIRFKEEHSLWKDQNLNFQARFFHLGFTIRTPVHMYEVVDGQATEIAYDDEMFDYGRSGVKAGSLPDNLGFAGFRLNFHDDFVRDVAAFQGASYFRAVGAERQYGQSARGLAVDCGMDRPEEFPIFVAYWLERPGKGSNTVTVYGLLDSASVVGAYRFVMTPGENFIMEIDSALYPRKAIDRVGIAPLTSMYQFGENDHRMANDWRPEIHDTDGLQLWTGNGEWIWRPLVNPRSVHVNSFFDENPRGFGLMQRDRNFDHYQDDGVFYDQRPCVWIEPKGDWGKGSVMLVEIPTSDETFDNIVAFWNPKEPIAPGKEYLYSYRLSWGAGNPYRPLLATTQATRTGLGGIIGQPRRYFSWRFAVDFAGGPLDKLPSNAKIEAVISASRGKVEITSARPLDAIKGWRAMFDLVPDAASNPIDLRLFLKLDGKPLSETWLYQYTPPPVAERKF
ncbi:MAG: glucan biosynthesis protein [Solimonas sp.]